MGPAGRGNQATKKTFSFDLLTQSESHHQQHPPVPLTAIPRHPQARIAVSPVPAHTLVVVSLVPYAHLQRPIEGFLTMRGPHTVAPKGRFPPTPSTPVPRLRVRSDFLLNPGPFLSLGLWPLPGTSPLTPLGYPA